MSRLPWNGESWRDLLRPELRVFANRMLQIHSLRQRDFVWEFRLRTIPTPDPIRAEKLSPHLCRRGGSQRDCRSFFGPLPRPFAT